ncbi:type II toxin-antitoxin system YafQ family toxin [Campylobacter sp. FMV-PI01]|uniref:Type II toxin-antitoxin system YafQ family toxin n=1 Tax=Campylobacter portucalensis TaxID=2608384 RepID=A0A6L5WJG5_9BACT|nr:type II toxin-antitoxin system YafQ family toxin [Campylobacter portucalensis]MSN95983.1 type II toxin-antitoxin system YafQ family toxin [Campylobacter portucalensis]
MLDLYIFNSFKKDLKRLEKQGFDKSLLMETLDFLLYEKPLPPRYKNHPLKGNYKGCYDCHIKPDCVLIYSIEENTLILHRIGSHSDLF